MVRPTTLTGMNTMRTFRRRLERSDLTPSLETRARRHYSVVNVAPSPDGFVIELDGRAVRTPGGRVLVLPTEALSTLAAAEWNRQAETVDLATMPVNRLARTAIDAFPGARKDVARRVTDYAADDLLCYFADEPGDLVRRQEKIWTPLLDWARDNLGLSFKRTAGIAHVDQSPPTLAQISAVALALTDFELIGLDAAARVFGSAILALAMLKRRLGAEEAFAACSIDETFQAETWGVDAEAAARQQTLRHEADILGQWFAALA